MWRPSNKQSPPPQPLLAVLPFQNLSGDAGTRYFSDGITEEIVDALLRTTQIRVAAPASSFRLRKVDAFQAATSLTATHVLSGSVQRNRGGVHVVAQLMDFRGNGIWSRTYDRAIAEVPELQHDIAVQIADALDMRVSPRSLSAAEHVNPAAYDHYLRGRDFFMQRDPDEALPELAESIRLDSRFAKAWSTLAAVRFLYASYTLAEAKDDYKESLGGAALFAAKRALKLDPNDGEALAVQALATSTDHLSGTDNLFQRALRAEPNDTQLLNWYTLFLTAVGREREDIAVLRRAYQLDRLTPVIALNLATVLVDEGEFQEAKKIMDLNPDSGNADYLNLRVRDRLLRHDWFGLARYLGTVPNDLEPVEQGYFRLAQQTAAALADGDTRKFVSLRVRWRQEGLRFDIHDVVQFLTALNDPDDALNSIELAVSRRRSASLMESPEWDALFVPDLAPLRRNPRVPALLAKWGLFDYWRATNNWPDFCDEPGLPFDCKAEAQKAFRSTSR